MPYYPQSTSGVNCATYPVGPTAAGLTLTASGSTNTKGSYSQLVASTAFASSEMQVVITQTDAIGGRFYLFDISVGAGGAEVVKVSNLIAFSESATATAYGFGLYTLRQAIGSGVRIAARVQCSTASGVIAIAVTCNSGGTVDGCASFTDFGTDVANSRGTVIDPGGTANTKGSYTEMTASTSLVIQELLMGDIRPNVNNANGTTTWACDIATGAGGAEVVLIPDVRIVSASNASSQSVQGPRGFRFITYIASATRLSMRASCSINTASTRTREFTLYGATAPAETSSAGGSYAFAG